MNCFRLFFITTFTIPAAVFAAQKNLDCSENFNGYWQSVREFLLGNINTLTDKVSKVTTNNELVKLKLETKSMCKKHAEKHEGELNKHFYYACYQKALEGYIRTSSIELKSRFSSLLISNALKCQVTIKKPIQFYDSGELRLDVDWQAYVTKELGWDSSFPYTAIDGACSAKIKDSVLSIYEGNSIPDANTGYYFFQIKESETGYDISWNGNRKFSHSQWHITEKAELVLKNEEVCLSHPAVEMCFSDAN